LAELEPLSLDVNGFFDHVVGEHGLRRADVDALAPRLVTILKDLAQRREAGRLPFYGLPYDYALIETVNRAAAELRQSYSTLVVLGIGGSALGARAVIEAVAPAQGGMRVEVLDNVDPTTILGLLADLDLKKTAFNVISKSGETAETMAQLLVVRDVLISRLGRDAYVERVLATTDAREGVLRRIAEKEGLRTLPVPEGVGGRFSVLSAVGLLPIAAAGLDISRLCAGARAMDVRTNVADPWRNPAALHAALLWLAVTKKDANIHVMMPYCDGLQRLAEWYGQLWAESLGKRHGLDGAILEVGQTPVRALGATDQHSQVQLYMEGPRDKVVTFLRVERHEEDVTIPKAFEDEEHLSYLGGHTLGELLNMEQRATELALAEKGRMTSVITVAGVEEATLGQLFHLFEVQTLVAGGLFGINPLDQPGVEAGKNLTRAMAGRRGTEELAAAIKKRLAAKHGDLILR
jgi:glucose-6-phosphate isomerase